VPWWEQMNLPAVIVAATVLASGPMAAANSTLDVHVTTGGDGLQVHMTSDIRGGLHADVTANSSGVTANARITLGPTVVTIDKPAGQPMKVDVSGLGLAPRSAVQPPSQPSELTAATLPVAAAPSVGVLDGLGSAASATADVAVRWIQAMVPFLLLGLLLIVLLPVLPAAVRGSTMQPPWGRLGVGLVALIAMPTAAIGLLVAGIFLGVWWLGLLMFGLFGLALAAGYTFTGMIVGRAVLDSAGGTRLHLFWTLLGGLAILSVLALVPYLGPAVVAVAVTYGLGALVLAPRTPFVAAGSGMMGLSLRLPAIRPRIQHAAVPAPPAAAAELSTPDDPAPVAQSRPASEVEAPRSGT